METRKSIQIRLVIIYVTIFALFCVAIARIFIIQNYEKEGWEALEKQLNRRGRKTDPTRGNIFACDGQLMATSVPYYHLYMDTRVEYLHIKNGANYKNNIDSLGICLSQKFGDRTPQEYAKMINTAYKRGDGKLSFAPRAVTHREWKEISNFPIFRKGKIRGGLIEEKFVKRVYPFGSLANRTIGTIYGRGEKGGSCGLELGYDSLLRGKKGYDTCQLLGNRWVYIPVVEPESGVDITSTIDVKIQDIAERALRKKLVEIDAERGCAIVMEVATGEVKACANLTRRSEGEYFESENMAVGDMSEPGSTFKAISMVVALENGIARPTDTIDTKNGVLEMYGQKMRDHNYKADGSGGYHKISVAEGIAYSSNIAVSKIIDDAYHKNPAKFVEGIYKTKINEPMQLEIPGAGKSRIRHPKDKKYWYKTTLPWMSIGYEIKMPPIYTLTFYNAIANDGKMIQPFFVKKISKNGETIEEFSARTINRSICSQKTLKEIRSMLEMVVEKGTGKVVGSPNVKIAGKTGTAQLQYGKGEIVRHQVSFCGYFPADNPKYSCIVVIRKPNRGYPSGGTMSGKVFKDIAERVYANDTRLKIDKMDNDTLYLPFVKAGKISETKKVLSKLDIDHKMSQGEWAKFVSQNEKVEAKTLEINKDWVPNVVGMGAKDAVYLMEKAGLRVQIEGVGTVKSQSILAGRKAVKNQTVVLILK